MFCFSPSNREEIKQAYSPKQKLERKNKAVLLLIIQDEKSHFLAVKSLSRLLQSLLHCLHSLRTESKLKSHESVCKNHDY